MKPFTLSLAPALILATASLASLPGGGFSGTASRSVNPEVVCSMPGNLDTDKIPADSAEVANDCGGVGLARVTRAIWWGGYIYWQQGDPDILAFDVRFYDDVNCTPGSLLAEYLEVTPDTTRLGDCSDGYPCFRYELEVDVDVGPGAFWMGIRTSGVFDPYPPRWGRLGDEVFDGCSTVWREDVFGQWSEPPLPPDWDASHEFVIDPTGTPIEPSSWSRVKSLHR